MKLFKLAKFLMIHLLIMDLILLANTAFADGGTVIMESKMNNDIDEGGSSPF